MGKCRKWGNVLAWSLLLACSVPYGARAQWAVYDAANHSTNLVTSFQSTITAVESVLHTGYWILDLTSLASNPLGSDFAVDIAELSVIIQDVQTILFDLQTIRNQTARIFGLQSAVSTTWELQQRLAEIRRIRAEMLCRARDIQTLPIRIIGVVKRIEILWQRILSVVGDKQNGQQIQAMLQQLTAVEAQSQTMLGAFNQAVLTDMAERPVVEESMQKITDNFLKDGPS